MSGVLPCSFANYSIKMEKTKKQKKIHCKTPTKMHLFICFYFINFFTENFATKLCFYVDGSYVLKSIANILWLPVIMRSHTRAYSCNQTQKGQV